ncbi:ABC transporter substrate-binding protein [Paenibacillus oceani]|uniref:Extracellular solute-binding protein n=1 Tax=Paenibacillus oceani TaxID=2772510 RepID=A0A927CG35_9BACL|nr:extracellular solute-binding protein [Paenibacillus oceani]MBD2865581.1 extracellular solute-binding protein [Paenibacillus oceani]
MKKTVVTFTVLTMLTALFAGCSSKKETGEAPGDHVKPEEAKPVELSVYRFRTNLTDDEFKRYFIEPVRSKYPHITLKMIVEDKGTTPEELLASGNFPDIVFTSTSDLQRLKDYKVLQPLDEYVKKTNADLGKVNPTIIETLRQFGDRGELPALPFSVGVGVMLYNKDIFDKFGEEYPRDGMTWDEVIQLSKRLSREDGGVRYIGFDPSEPALIASQLSLSFVDLATSKSVIDSEEWKRVFQMVQQSYQASGILGNEVPIGREVFIKDKTLAMFPLWADNFVGRFEDELKKGGFNLNWDMVALPNFPEAVGTGREATTHSMVLSNLSKHKDEAFQVMAHMLSDQVQSEMTKNGRVTPLASADIQKLFGANLQNMKGKHVAAIFNATPRKMHKPSPYDQTIVRPEAWNAAVAIRKGQDLNTVIRTTKELVDKKIEAELKK